jgi:hypothetical protein
MVAYAGPKCAVHYTQGIGKAYWWLFQIACSSQSSLWVGRILFEGFGGMRNKPLGQDVGIILDANGTKRQTQWEV